MAPGDFHACLRWLRPLLPALLLVAPSMPGHTVSNATPGVSGARPAAAATRFSELTEITPANVGGLLPLVARAAAVARQDPQLEVPTASNVSTRPRVDEWTDTLELMRLEHPQARALPARQVVSYLLGAAATVGAPSELRAWDPIDRQVLWSVREAPPISSGTLVTAGGLVFYGTDDGWFKALDARTGRVLWTHRAPGRRLDEPLSYRGADGHQYIAVRAEARTAQGTGETLLFALAH